jgi:PAS domain S-box-containing protein
VSTAVVIVGLVVIAALGEALRRARREARHWRIIVEHIPQMVWTASAEGVPAYMNPLHAELIAAPFDDTSHAALREAIHPESRQAILDAWLASVASGRPFEYQHRLRNREGDYRWLVSKANPVRDRDGRIVTWAGSTTDVTSYKQLEDDMRRTLERLDRAVQASKIFLWEFDLVDGELDDTRSTLVNYYESVGLDPTIPLRRGWLLATVHPDDQAGLHAATLAVIAGDVPEFTVEYRAYARGGELRHYLARGVVARSATGVPVRFMGSAVDVSELKRAQERLHRAVASSQMSVWELDLQPRATAPGAVLNAWETRGHGEPLPPADLRGVIAMVIAPVDQQRVLDALESCIQGRTQSVQVDYQAAGYVDGSLHWRLASATVTRDADGKPLQMLGTSIDITDSKRAQLELQTAKDAAERANRAKDEFLANVSHEIRTPMNAILALTELALDSSLMDHQRKLLATVKSAADSLLGIINDLLDFSKIEAGKIELDAGELSLRALLEDTLPALVIRAHRKGLELTWHVDPDVPDALIGDLGRLRQVILNLVGNAVKFTHEGEVRVEVRQAAATGDAIGLELIVRDTGVGISLDKQDQIFRAFVQEDSSTTRRYGGTGLGLTISAKLVALMGGAITVDSAPGRGSSFTATVQMQPVRSVERAPARPVPWTRRLPAPGRSLQILVAEDNELNVSVLEQLFAQRGHHGHFARDGRGALALVGSAAFDVMLLDVHMPELDGFDVAHAIRASERGTGRHLPIIAFTARSALRHRERCLAAGMDDFLAKPVDARTLWSTIERWTTIAPVAPPGRLLDLTAIGRACGRDSANLEKLCEVFVRSVPLQLGRVRSALDTGNIERLRDAAHALYGTLTAFSGVAGAAVSDLEELAARGELDDCRPRFHQVQLLCQGVVEEARSLSLEQVVQPEARR